MVNLERDSRFQSFRDELKKITSDQWKQILLPWFLWNMVGFIIYGATYDLQQSVYFINGGNGCMLGAFQWLAIRKSTGLDWWWIVTSIPVYVFPYLDFQDIGITILKISFTLFIWGFLQWLALRETFHHAFAWPFASAGSGILATVISILIANLLSSPGYPSSFIIWILFGIIYSSLTGATMVILYNLPKPKKGTIWF